MIPTQRDWFNENFTDEKYQEYLNYIKKDFPGALDFRVAETPVFIGNIFKQKMLSVCETIIDEIVSPNFKDATQKAIPSYINVKAEEGIPHFLIFDFGICENDSNGEVEPMLIEMQGFATLFAYQLHQYKAAAHAYHLPESFSPFFKDFDEYKTIQLLKEVIIGESSPEHTILLEIFPEKQKTRIDFEYTRKYLGIEIVCVTKLVKEGNNLFYEKNGKLIKIERIYNRLIFDELYRQTPEVQEKAKVLFEDLDVQWVTHPNWFYRISKYALPFLNHPNIPKTFFLKDLAEIPHDLENYVLKPLFSFAGNGVIIDVTREDIERIRDPENYILQKKVNYIPIIRTMDDNAKAEIRVFYLWKEGELRPVAAYNLARLSKGKMISVALNKNKTWVGGSFALFGAE
ncbi:MAG TPA: hypothetical protein VFQ86_13625 [Arachidicoccus soli]|uniref:Circularly permuted type 2 ATP-grasp protein n=1 Tax=Arachidicoccus soli TaxID=2341117 RepID=A0A386HTW8_9BACT|nr:hypothetical protein [Arachidicoccus soli]AYD48796.1 hypothetical protein D6B99_14985 [Arachidicoccus soli]HEU0228773.1 hypothetical protein [Arachidicoccus soli]